MPFGDRFLTSRLLQKCSTGFLRLVVSLQNKTQLLQTALAHHKSSCLSRWTFWIDRTNTTLLKWCCFMSCSSVLWPRVGPVTLGQYLLGQLLGHGLAPRDPEDSNPKATRSWLIWGTSRVGGAELGSCYSCCPPTQGNPGLTPRGPRGLGRQVGATAGSVASFSCLADRDPWLPLCC